jgi:hypothetical protein
MDKKEDDKLLETKDAENIWCQFSASLEIAKQNKLTEWQASATNSYERMIVRILARKYRLNVRKANVERYRSDSNRVE